MKNDFFSVPTNVAVLSSQTWTGTKSGLATINLKEKFRKIAVVVNVLQTTQNLIISRCCFAAEGKEMYKAQPLFCLLKLLFRGVTVADPFLS